VREGEQGPMAIELVTRRVQTRLERTRTGPQEGLVVTRHPRADDCLLETQASREACEQDARYTYCISRRNLRGGMHLRVR
jgi:hypothetical protein